MRLYIFFVLMFLSSAFSAQGIFSPIEPFPNYNESILNTVYSTYIPKYDTMFLAWADNTSDTNAQPYYALYDCNKNKFIIEPSVLSTGWFIGVSNFVSSCYNPINDTVFVTIAAKQSDPYAWYKVFDCKTNTFIVSDTEIPESVFAQTTPICSYNPTNNSIFLTWSGRFEEPTYAIYDCTTSSFTTNPTKLLSGNYQANSTVNHVYSSKSNKSLITWCDSSSQEPYYIIFDHSTSSHMQTPLQIPNPDNFTGNSLNGCFNSKQNEAFICAKSVSADAIYSIYDFSINAFTSSLMQLDDISGFSLNPAYSQHNNSIFLVLGPAINTNSPSYCIFECKNNTLSTPPTLINASYSQGCNFPFATYNTKHNNIFLTWSESSKIKGQYCNFHEIKERTKQLINDLNSLYYQKGLK